MKVFILRLNFNYFRPTGNKTGYDVNVSFMNKNN